MDNLEKIEILENEMTKGRDSLARIDVIRDITEQEYLQVEKCTLGWFEKLKRLNELEKERRLVVARMADVAMARHKLKMREDIRIARRKEVHRKTI